MSVIFKAGVNGGLKMFMTEGDISSHTNLQPSSSSSSSPSPPLTPKVKSNVYIKYEDWLDRYYDYLVEYVDNLFVMVQDQGVVLHYSDFTNDMFKYIYKTSVSRYLNFTFLDN